MDGGLVYLKTSVRESESVCRDPLFKVLGKNGKLSVSDSVWTDDRLMSDGIDWSASLCRHSKSGSVLTVHFRRVDGKKTFEVLVHALCGNSSENAKKLYGFHGNPFKSLFSKRDSNVFSAPPVEAGMSSKNVTWTGSFSSSKYGRSASRNYSLQKKMSEADVLDGLYLDLAASSVHGYLEEHEEAVPRILVLHRSNKCVFGQVVDMPNPLTLDSSANTILSSAEKLHRPKKNRVARSIGTSWYRPGHVTAEHFVYRYRTSGAVTRAIAFPAPSKCRLSVTTNEDSETVTVSFRVDGEANMKTHMSVFPKMYSNELDMV